ncbi:hypothetical protein B0H10DRAFT_1798435 [Mycena sp. CBHHK59/15]|nr:hypothetical protein B0H10DRAFT_1798435 [Mycena sp. CBHHK59/15]
MQIYQGPGQSLIQFHRLGAEEFQLDHCFVMDNATNNDTMVEAFGQRCKEKGIKFSCSDARMRCMPHTIHLSALKVTSPSATLVVNG